MSWCFGLGTRYPPSDAQVFTKRVVVWLRVCFGDKLLKHRQERGLRVLEEALELAQSLGVPRDQAGQVLNVVYCRPPGDPRQEVAGVMVALAGCGPLLNFKDPVALGVSELERINIKPVEYFRLRNCEKADLGISHYKDELYGEMRQR